MSDVISLSPRALLHLLFNGARAIDVVGSARELGIFEALDPGPATLGALSERLGADPGRLYKFLDCLESLGLVRREQDSDELVLARYRAVAGARAAAETVLGSSSLERDREKFDWRAIHGALPEVLTGERSIPAESFDWPPSSDEQIESFERSMAAGLGPIVESFVTHGASLFPAGTRLLDVGGGDGSLAAHLLEAHPRLEADVYNLPATEPLVRATAARRGVGERLGFVGGSFLDEPLPRGYDAISFVRVLHDWPAAVSRDLLRSASEALAPGGRLLICEEFRTADRLAAQFFWSYFLMGVDRCTSRLREVEFYLDALRDLGFRQVEVLPGPFEIVSAVR
ncbi:methyltransferase [Vulgatibacter incomptus]|uniref:Hydroxyneurosporene methyltransferase n=1 Tax=Vulgatibacter incomptus TaxID=1391653 RepID=A0A0K1PDX0_9BACT|nr:methyltransferase [Vulgatibacter incomptus]AKU91621.1 Hydroxyneurosporene methyltransferase [Vulgatibacter incomptus]